MPDVDDPDLPRYTVFVPMYQEADHGRADGAGDERICSIRRTSCG